MTSAPTPVTPALAGALQMHRAGYHVHPCRIERDQKTGRKDPKGLPNGWATFGQTEEQIVREFGQGANGYMIACGPGGLVVVDIDCKDGAQGFRTWGARPAGGLIVRTPSGGVHHYFTNDQGVGTSKGADTGLDGVDIRGIGGGVFGPGSLDGAYVIEHSGELQPWSSVGLVIPESSSHATKGLDASLQPAVTPERAQAVIAGHCQAVYAHAGTWAGNGFRHTLMKAAFVLGGYVGAEQITHDNAAERLAEAISAAGYEPDDDDLLWIEQGLTDGSRQPLVVREAPLSLGTSVVMTPYGAIRVAEGPRGVSAWPSAGVVPRRARWIWEGRIPQGGLTLLGGREGIGKSTVCYQLAADISRGLLPGEYQGVPKPVVIAASEDSWEHTIVPRLMAAKANLDLVYRIEAVVDDDVMVGLSLPVDLPGVKKIVTQLGAALILLDPLMSRLDSKIDTHKDSDVRRGLEPLINLAQDCNAAVLGLIHVNKGGSSDPLSSLMGSRAFAAVARSVLYCLADPEDESERRKLLALAKSNLGRMDLPSLTFEIDNTFVCQTDDGPIYTGAVRWTGEEIRGLRDLIEVSQQGGEHRSATTDAAEWIQEYLASRQGREQSTTVKQEAKRAGHSERTLKRALAKLSEVVSESEGFPRVTFWCLHNPTLCHLSGSCTRPEPVPAGQTVGPSSGATHDQQW